VAWGPPIQLSENDFLNRGADILIEDWHGFANRTGLLEWDSEAKKKEAKTRRLLSDCHLVEASQSDERTICLQPMLDVGKGRSIGDRNGPLQVKLPVAPSEFFNILSGAFDRCYVTEL
jgi:hypothetical protein